MCVALSPKMMWDEQIQTLSDSLSRWSFSPSGVPIVRVQEEQTKTYHATRYFVSDDEYYQQLLSANGLSLTHWTGGESETIALIQ